MTTERGLMTNDRATCRSAECRRRRHAFLGVAAALFLFFFGFAAHAAPAAAALSADDLACLECHARPQLEKSLGNGQKLSLHVAGKPFARSVHGGEGCAACHSGLEDGHDKQPRKIASRRALATELMEQCRDCHKKTMKQYEDSVHSALVRAGSDKAPLCTDCHDPHATRSAKEQGGGQALAAPCGKCHEAVSKAFADSVHGQGGEEALVCKDCHRTHDVKPAAFGDHLRNQCVSCHKDVAGTHAQWLPNTQRHLEAISCAACHSPGTTRRVDLRLYEGAAPHQAGKVGVPTFEKSGPAGSASPGLDARALWSLLQEFNQDGVGPRTVVRGRLEVQTGVQAHQLGAKALAVADCDTCHRRGAASFQAVTVSMAGPDGRPLRREANQGILTSIESVGAVGGFYAIGSTRIVLLDVLLVLAVAGGIALPGAHLAAKLYFRRQRERRALEAAAAAQHDDRSAS